ncbi:MAG: hypothetical protein ACXWQ5_21755, partial [Ktedonobacterales bacterium]
TVRVGLDDQLRRKAREQLRERLRQLMRDAAALEVDARELREWIEVEMDGVYAEIKRAEVE